MAVRGNGRQDVFLSDEDRQRFLDQLQESAEKDGIRVFAYVLMSNHYHLLIETPRANVSAFMQRLNTAYGMYFRYRHQRPGHVWQGRFTAKLVEDDDYLLQLTRYVHRNPVKVKRLQGWNIADRVAYLRAYVWSSYPAYVRPINRDGWLDLRCRALIGGRDAGAQCTRYRRYVERLVDQDDPLLREALRASAYAVGSEDFVRAVERDLRCARDKAQVRHDVAWPVESGVPLDAVDEAVCRILGGSAEGLRERGRQSGLARSVAIEVACRISGASQRAVGRHYGGISGTAVTRHRLKLAALRRKDPSVAKLIDSVLASVRVPES